MIWVIEVYDENDGSWDATDFYHAKENADEESIDLMERDEGLRARVAAYVPADQPTYAHEQMMQPDGEPVFVPDRPVCRSCDGPLGEGEKDQLCSWCVAPMPPLPAPKSPYQTLAPAWKPERRPMVIPDPVPVDSAENLRDALADMGTRFMDDVRASVALDGYDIRVGDLREIARRLALSKERDC